MPKTVHDEHVQNVMKASNLIFAQTAHFSITFCCHAVIGFVDINRFYISDEKSTTVNKKLRHLVFFYLLSHLLSFFTGPRVYIIMTS